MGRKDTCPKCGGLKSKASLMCAACYHASRTASLSDNELRYAAKRYKNGASITTIAGTLRFGRAILARELDVHHLICQGLQYFVEGPRCWRCEILRDKCEPWVRAYEREYDHEGFTAHLCGYCATEEDGIELAPDSVIVRRKQGEKMG